MLTRKYFNVSENGMFRIMIVDSNDEAGFTGLDREILKSDLPLDFEHWYRTTDNAPRTFNHPDTFFRGVMSKSGN
jgi:hypothetical protein